MGTATFFSMKKLVFCCVPPHPSKQRQAAVIAISNSATPAETLALDPAPNCFLPPGRAMPDDSLLLMNDSVHRGCICVFYQSTRGYPVIENGDQCLDTCPFLTSCIEWWETNSAVRKAIAVTRISLR